jgi:hypothetical protein
VQVIEPYPDGYLYQPTFCIDHKFRYPARPYLPQPGDIYLSTEDQWMLARVGHKVARSGAPHHSGVVFQRPDGRMALLEGGPENTLYIRALDLIPTLRKYYTYERVWIRQRKIPLTCEQSRRLTTFAMAHADTSFGVVRMVMEGGPFRKKGYIRSRFIGRPDSANFDPNDPLASKTHRYYCSELATEALVAAQLLDPVTTRPPSMYPRELYMGTSDIPYVRRHLDMTAWLPPSRWTAFPGTEPALRELPWIDGDDRDCVR